ncbi:NifB/NifX family molybdenum-iron cluster-binding protein [Clostridium aminobutyricum]|uniref:NifB/NifX family molybdenum-iron cluster-binding protein n=1 Tax=Clostridium aminobutyricum TaxID=33953 RepID=A0A939D8Z4_CLOAM|nr:NifB/NifX family molybdenum-iron cluster-binding protein [Clostridium aminobutyricum]MBN7773417.1 NifB/NifX family molybdenum-iron cluster-binding protein [Clostridium aminobutyricum]
MRVAVPYENGTVFQHFGHSKQFKIYEIDKGQVTSSEIMEVEGGGHGALAGFLQRKGVNVLICGGIGEGAKTAISAAGMNLFSGVSGEADTTIQSYLNGTLQYSTEATCDHHDHGEDHACGVHKCGGKCH